MASISNHSSERGEKPQSEALETAYHDIEKSGAITDHELISTRALCSQIGESLVQFDPTAERRLRNKLDYMIVPTVSILYLFCFIDRTNIGMFYPFPTCTRWGRRMLRGNVGNARLAGFEKDLGLKNYDYNIVLSIFYISYIVFEIPSNLACKYFGPGWFLPAISLGFGITSLGTAFVHTKAAACGVRFLLGIFEAGMMPGISYYLSRWYRRSELTFRLSLFIVMAPLAGAFGGLLASGILTLDHFGSLHAQHSERMAQTTVLDKFDKKKLWLGFWNPMVLSTAFIFLLNNITVQGLAFFTPTIVSSIYPTKTTIEKQLFTVPPYVVGAVFVLGLSFSSWRFDRRVIFILATAPFTMVGYILFLASHEARVRYAATFLAAISTFAAGPLANAQVSAVVVSDTSRSMAIGTNVMFGNIGGLISTWSYLPYDAPNYKIGNGINLAGSSIILIVSILQLLWMAWDNKRRDAKDVDAELQGLAQSEMESLEWKHPGFRWRP
ncbi:hypothetical protein RRF57_001767 [Xylaria bambusicola]|uniref:Major facilitator superfamily (MFS) profile domain-containing protein n=1 Tax=Xylaria bambusicola TaxID=326684 RepID=A0AAN7UEA7_9PEZI